MASTGCFFHNRRAIRLSSRRANRQSSRSTRFVVIASLFCIVGPPSGDLPLSEDQPRINPIPYVGISGLLRRHHGHSPRAVLPPPGSSRKLRREHLPPCRAAQLLQLIVDGREQRIAIDTAVHPGRYRIEPPLATDRAPLARGQLLMAAHHA